MSAAPHPFTLRQLQYVVAVGEELSFRRAAARCHVSQPSLSAQLAQVEGALGVRLFERAHKRVLVTAPGRDLVGRAKRLLLEADEIVRAAQRVADPLSGTIRLGVIPTISPYLLPKVTPALRRVRWLGMLAGCCLAGCLALDSRGVVQDRQPDPFLQELVRQPKTGKLVKRSIGLHDSLRRKVCAAPRQNQSAQQ